MDGYIGGRGDSHMRIALILSLAMAGWLQYSLWMGHNGVLDLMRVSAAVSAQHEDNERLSERNAALNAEVVDLKTGLEAIEERARADLGMVREGERFHHIVSH
jgi:cell division protein FtsB